MAKPKRKIQFKLPEYIAPRSAWRRLIYEEAKNARDKANVEYTGDDLIELNVILYLLGNNLFRHDVDNRLKDIMDSLQGRLAGTGSKKPSVEPLIPNDSQVYRVTIEKDKPHKVTGGYGRVTVTNYVASRRHRKRIQARKKVNP